MPERERSVAEIIVAPNMDFLRWAGSSIVRVAGLELLSPSGRAQIITPGRPVFLVAESVPRAEMRTFLEQCEDAVVTTGDQSMAEAVLLGKVPMARPDAKAAQWELALACAASGGLEAVPDLGESMRRLLWSAAAQAEVAAASAARSAEVEAQAVARFGEERTPAQETLLRAGMLG